LHELIFLLCVNSAAELELKQLGKEVVVVHIILLLLDPREPFGEFICNIADLRRFPDGCPTDHLLVEELAYLKSKDIIRNDDLFERSLHI
jgi:hypothetical protein